MPMNRHNALPRLARNEAGVAAIEMALILPVLLILFFGLVNLTAVLSDNRRLAYSANAVADLVSRLDTPTTAARIGDAFNGVELIMAASRTGTTRVEIYNFGMVDGDAVLKWSRTNGAGTPCGAPGTSGLNRLMTAGNDVIVAIVCVVHTPIVTNLIGQNTLGGASFNLREQIVMRPRKSLTLSCSDC
jgi:Flp pilus assembly protein TadG